MDKIKNIEKILPSENIFQEDTEDEKRNKRNFINEETN